jgi:hypothetical protein
VPATWTTEDVQVTTLSCWWHLQSPAEVPKEDGLNTISIYMDNLGK